MKKSTVWDIHSYTVFANIDDRKGSIKGYMIYLSKQQYEAIEDIIISSDITIKKDYAYEIIDDKRD